MGVPLLILVLIAGAVLVEGRTFLVERAAGRYLNRSNADREPWGRSWERQQKSQEAARRLDERILESDRIRGEVELIAGFGELIGLLSEEQGVQLSPAKFVELYRALPEPLSRRVMEPGELANLYLAGDWQRTSLWRRDGGALAYLIDTRNRVMRHIFISPGLLEAAEWFGRSFPGRLEDDPRWAGRIYSADRFFTALFGLPDDDRARVFLDPGLLLSLPRQVTSVGVAPLDKAEGYDIVGFEAVGEDGATVTTYPALSAPLSKVIWTLVWEGSDTIFSSKSRQPAQEQPGTGSERRDYR